jgi:hypothetical protein
MIKKTKKGDIFTTHFNISIKNSYEVNIQNIIVNKTTHSLLI